MNYGNLISLLILCVTLLVMSLAPILASTAVVKSKMVLRDNSSIHHNDTTMRGPR
jgi:hypothetical protein